MTGLSEYDPILSIYDTDTGMRQQLPICDIDVAYRPAEM